MDPSLHDYVSTRSPDAFRVLVDAHLPVIYNAARRQLADPALADDVSQAVFLLLSQKAPSLLHGPPLIAWLLKVTHYACRDARKRAARRRFHEQKAAAMRQESTPPISPQADALSPLLDAALAKLHPADRAALSLRYFQNLPLRDVGNALHLTEGAARKRIERALARLRALLASHGLTTSAAMLTTSLATLPALAVPPALTTAIVAGHATPLAASLAAATGKSLLWSALKLPAAIAAALAILAGATATILPHLDTPTPAAPALATPAASPKIPTNLASLRGHLLTPDNHPATNVPFRVYRITHHFHDETLETQGTTDAKGAFSTVPLATDPPFGFDQRLMIFDAPGFAVSGWRAAATDDPFTPQDRLITLQRPTSVSGTITDESGQPIRNALIHASIQELIAQPDGSSDESYWSMSELTGFATRTDAAGHYQFTRIPASARVMLGVSHPDYASFSTEQQANYFPIAPGTTDADFHLAPGLNLCIQLTRNGLPFPRAGVEMYAIARSNHGISFHAKTNAAGLASVHSLVPGSYDIIPDGDSPTHLPDPLCPRRGITLSQPHTLITVAADPAPLLQGQLTNETTHAPLQEPFTIHLPTDQLRPIAKVTPDATGHFAVPLPPGEYVARLISWPNGRRKHITQNILITSTAPTQTFNLAITPRPILHGQLVDSAGNPISGYVWLGGWFASDVQGRLSIPAPDTFDGEVGVACNAPRSLARLFAYLPQNPDAPLNLTLVPTATVTAKIPPSTAIVPGIHPGFLAKVNNELSDGVNSIGTATVQPDRQLVLTAVPIGFPLTLQYRTLQSSQIDDLAPGEIRSTDFFDPGPPSTQTATGSASLSGVVVNEHDQPIGGLRVSVSSATQPCADTLTDHRGRFSFTHLPDAPILRLSADIEGLPDRPWTSPPNRSGLRLKLLPPHYPLLDKPAPPLIVDQWLANEPAQPPSFKNRVTLLQIGANIAHRPSQMDWVNDLRPLYDKYHAAGLDIITIHDALEPRVDPEVSPATLSDMLHMQEIPWPVALDADAAKAPDSVPTRYSAGATYSVFQGGGFFLIDRRGILRAPRAYEGTLDAEIQKLLAESP